jgi:hypothetical protein
MVKWGNVNPSTSAQGVQLIHKILVPKTAIMIYKTVAILAALPAAVVAYDKAAAATWAQDCA